MLQAYLSSQLFPRIAQKAFRSQRHDLRQLHYQHSSYNILQHGGYEKRIKINLILSIKLIKRHVWVSFDFCCFMHKYTHLYFFQTEMKNDELYMSCSSKRHWEEDTILSQHKSPTVTFSNQMHRLHIDTKHAKI